jgi:phospholipid N-methyltransferase
MRCHEWVGCGKRRKTENENRERFLRYFHKEAARMIDHRVAEWMSLPGPTGAALPQAGRLLHGPVHEAHRMPFIRECVTFFRECRRHFRATGAILPSSRFLARALVYHLRQPRRAARILEVGPGTGSVTRAIARHMLPEDRLDAVEINERFVAHLERSVGRDRAFARCREQVQVIHAGVEDLVGDSVYDYIVSGLPLNNFTVAQVREVFASFSRLLKPGGVVTFYEYQFVRLLKTPFVGRMERRRLARVGRVMWRYVRDFQVRRERVFINVPPATVRHLRLKPLAAAPVVPSLLVR